MLYNKRMILLKKYEHKNHVKIGCKIEWFLQEYQFENAPKSTEMEASDMLN